MKHSVGRNTQYHFRVSTQSGCVHRSFGSKMQNTFTTMLNVLTVSPSSKNHLGVMHPLTNNVSWHPGSICR